MRNVHNIAPSSSSQIRMFPAKIPGSRSVALSVKLFVPFATPDNGVYVWRKEGGSTRSAKVLALAARKLRQRMAITALTASQDTTLIIIRRLVTLVTLLAAFATRVNFFLRSASKKECARARAHKRQWFYFPLSEISIFPYLSLLSLFFSFHFALFPLGFFSQGRRSGSERKCVTSFLRRVTIIAIRCTDVA